MTEQAPTQPTTEPPARRRPGRPRNDQNRIDVLDAAQGLLAQHSLDELTVSEIISAAGVARGTFYSYFESKQSVAAALLERVMDEILETIQSFINPTDGLPVQEALRLAVDGGCDVWARNRVVLGTVSEQWYAVPELRRQWLDMTDRFSLAIAAEIDRQRAVGLAPSGHDSLELSAGLVHSTIQCLYLAGLEDFTMLRDERSIADMILAIWCGAIYRTPPPRAGDGKSK